MADTLSNNVRTTPIGVFRYNLGNIWEALSKNVGTFAQNDGSVTPIGFLSNPDYVLNDTSSWFKNDLAKQKSNTYIGYLENVLSGYTSSMNVYEWRDVSSDRTGSRIIDSLDDVISGITASEIKVTDKDTRLGDISNRFLGISMQDAYAANSKKKVLSKGISSDINGYFGINSAVTSGGNIFSRYVIDEDSGRLLYNFHPDSSPIYNKPYPNIGMETGKWRNYYQLMYMTNPYTKAYILGSMNSLDLVYELGLTNGILDINLFNSVNLDINSYITKNNARFNMYYTYFDKMSNRTSNGSSLSSIGYDIDEYDNIWRYKLSGFGNKTTDENVSFEYAESEIDQEYDGNHGHDGKYNEGIAHGYYSSEIGNDNNNDLIFKTKKAFVNGKYRTLVSRFHSSGEDEKLPSEINSAVDIWKRKYGMSHGRNLLRKRPEEEDSNINSYDDPYCRVWTHHHEYHNLLDAIRPFQAEWTNNGDGVIMTQKELAGTNSGNHTPSQGDDYGDIDNKYHWNLFSSRDIDNFDTGRVRLGNYGVINQDNGLVNFVPTRNGAVNNNNMFVDSSDKNVAIKKCMFSIENLAWKGEQGKHGKYRLSKEQTGPLGGRIMWFPPYNLTFNEVTQANWQNTTFIGRGEPIYTYTDTSRTGNLSFSILIDHPSVIDYWRLNHDKENNGNDDNATLDGNEQTLLRFFAGCEVLIPQPFYFDKDKEKPHTDVPPTPKKKNNDKKITFWVFYPNNYSGVDDAPNGTAKHHSINTIEYLLNGVGTQMQILANNNQKLQDIPTSMERFGNNPIGGYETRKKSSGISILTGPFSVKDGRTLYKGKTTYGKMLTSIIGSSGDITLATRWVNPNKWNKKGATSEQKISEWYYRVDNVYATQGFENKENFLDKMSYGFNTEDGLSDLLKNAVKHNIFTQEEADNVSNDANMKGDMIFVTLADMYCLFNSTAKNTLTGGTNGELYSENRISAIDKALEHKITNIVINGYASAQGYNNNVNSTIAANRAKTVKSWLKSASDKFNREGIEWHINDYKYPNRVTSSATDVLTSNTKSNIINDDKGTGRIAGDVDDETAKFFRCAHVDIYYSDDEDDTVKSMTSSAEKENSVSTIIPTAGVGYKVLVSQKYGSVTVSQTTADALSEMKKEGNTNALDNYIEQNPDLVTDKLYKEKLKTALNKKAASINNTDNIENKNKIDSKNGDSLNDVLHRYDLESIFFKNLEINEPFLHHQITDKIKYFDPAFHSITPEGFNARLTFLQQCMRAGQTHSASDIEGKTKNANNMAFGRPPICVLRVGDFYNTRIVINNLNIKYEQWDLNMEGIGVQPMIANVDLSFTFIGGSDLAGPISRLQNALSFNYYANTGVYDNRAEMVEYDENGQMSKFKGVQFSDPNMDSKNDTSKKS